MQYKTEFLLDISISEGIEYAIEGHKLKQEDRLYDLWVQIATSPYSKAPSFSVFKDEAKGKKEKKPETKLAEKKLGTLKGQDLTRG